MLHDLRNSCRLIGLAFILAREDALFVLEALGPLPVPVFPLRLIARGSARRKRRGQRLAHALTRMGPSFIKFGQALSMRSDIIGEELAQDLAALRDNLPPFPAHIARETVSQELGVAVENLFTRFDDTPVAAASIAQVHRAQMKDGRNVAVKVLRPKIEQAFARDIGLMFWLARKLERSAPSLRRLKPVEVVDAFQDTVRFELDLRNEAAAATELARNLAQDQGFRVPAVDWPHTACRVLTMEWVDGIPISDVAGLRAAGIDIDAVLVKLAESFFKQALRDGFFHADLHPGNLFVDAEGNIVAVDFGIMGRLDWKTRLALAEMLGGFLNEDFRRAAEVHFEAGYVPAHKSVEDFALACMAIAKPILGKPLNEISMANLLSQLFKVTEAFEMETQPQLLLLQKTMVSVEGIGRMLNPQVNLWNLARPVIDAWGRENLGIAGRMRENMRDAASSVRRLPEWAAQADRALRNMGDPKGIRLHPDTVKGLNRPLRAGARKWFMLGWSVLMTVAVVALLAR